jgi:sulfate transport system substrate-binding protein
MPKRVKKVKWKRYVAAGIAVVAIGGGFLFHHEQSSSKSTASVTITNVSYDPTRELYAAYNQAFASYWKEKTGQTVSVSQSNGGSGKQANSVIEGNAADVVTLALDPDISSIEDAGLINKGWQDEFADDSAPYTSTIVMLVRKGNPKNIQDWSDLTKSGVDIITPNPKTSGGARWNYLAAWAYAETKFNHDEAKCQAFVKQIYQNVSVLDSSARAATTTFAENGQGDVLLAWENEAYLTVKENPGEYEIITPSISMKAEPSVAVVDAVTKKRGTTKVATAYLKYLYSEKAQKIIAKNYYRPTNEKVAKAYASKFKALTLVDIDDAMFGGWSKVDAKHFGDGGIFDQIYNK